MERPFPAYRGDGEFVFVCYAHEDSELVYPEIGWLHERGVKLWYDEGISAGRNWRSEIGVSLERSAKVLFYISDNSLKSHHCNREINFALDEGKEIVPVYLQAASLTPDLKIGLNRVQALHRFAMSVDGYRGALLDSLTGSSIRMPADAATKDGRPGHRVAWLSLVVGVLAVIGVLAMTWWWMSGRATSDLRVQITQLTANPLASSLSGAAISPDGNYLAYTTPQGLYLQVLANGDTHRLEISAVTDFQPTQVHWYPDGSRLLLLVKEHGGPPGLWSLSTFGGRPARVADNVSRAAIAPDGTAIAYIPDVDSEGQGRREVWRMGPDGEDAHRILSVGAGDSVWRVTWSPDSEHLAVGLWSYLGADATRGTRIELMRADGTGRRPFIEDTGLFQHWTGVLPFVWCADGTFVYARADSPSDPLTSNVWKALADSSSGAVAGKEQVTRWVGSNVRELSASYDCGEVAALLVRNQADVMVAELASGGTGLTEETQVTFDEREDRVVGWSNDASELIIQSSRSGMLHFYRLAVASGEMSRITPRSTGAARDPSFDFNASWDPSGEWILYMDDADVKRMPRGGGAVETVIAGDYRAIRCVVAGQRCVAGHVEGSDYVFSEFNPVGGAPKELARTQYRVPFTNWDLAPDGQRVAVVYMDDDLVYIVSLESGEVSTVNVADWRNFEFVSWAADGAGLFINAGFSISGSYAALLYVSLEGDVSVLRQRANEWHVFPQASPDGEYLAFSVMPFQGNAWLLRGL